jgi:hypothetical protein
VAKWKVGKGIWILSSGLSKWHYWLIKKINKMSLLGFEKNGRNKATWKSRCFAFSLFRKIFKIVRYSKYQVNRK